MKNLDDALQNHLDAIEDGVPVPEVISRLQAEDAELAPLIQLAGAVHSTAHPQVNTARAMEDKRKMNTAYRAQTTTRGRWFSMPVMLGAAAVMLALVIGLVAVFAFPAADTAQIANVSGLVEVASSDTAEDWRIVSSGDPVKAGERVRTYDGSSVTLAFSEGSYTMLGPNADVTLATLDGGRGTINLALMQRAGRTNHRVVPFDGKDSSFVVQTPNGDARVHGTSFAVAVDPVGKALFSVTTGKVEVNSGGSQVFLLPGQASLASAEIGLEEPAYTFGLRGAVQEIGTTSWKVDGVTVMVNEQTQITGSPVLGSIVEVSGRILEGNVWQADSIALVTETEPQPSLLTYTGVVNSMGATEWQIGSATVQVNSATMIDPDLQSGDVAKVTFQVLADGSWLAVSIEKMGEEEEPLPTETPVPTSIAPASDLQFQPGSAEMYGCAGDSFSTEGTLVNTGAAAVSNVRLEALVIDGAGYVDSATVSPERIDSIGAGGSAGFSVSVDMNGNWATAVDQTVTVRVLLSHTTNGPVQENAQFDFTIHSGCEPSATATGTPVVTLTPEVTPSAPASVCTGADPQPTGMRLAAEFGVPYEEIMGWFCQNFGFGEIKSAYEMSRASGVPVEDIFTMRRSGMGWGNIKKLVNDVTNPVLTGTPEPPKGNDKDNPGKGPDKPKPTKKPNPNKKP